MHKILCDLPMKARRPDHDVKSQEEKVFQWPTSARELLRILY